MSISKLSSSLFPEFLKFYNPLFIFNLFSIGGSKEKSKSTSETTGKKTVTESTSGTKDTSSTLSSEDLKTISALDEDTKNLLTDFLTQLGDGAGADKERITGIIDVLQEKALTAEEDINANTEALIAEARLQGEKELGRSVTQLASATGSSQNSLVSQIANEGAVDLESRLAALGSEFALQARSAQVEELNSLIGAIGQGSAVGAQDVSSIASLASILKGATVTSTGTSTQTGATAETATGSRNAVEDIVSTTKSKGKSKGSSIGFNL